LSVLLRDQSSPDPRLQADFVDVSQVSSVVPTEQVHSLLLRAVEEVGILSVRGDISMLVYLGPEDLGFRL